MIGGKDIFITTNGKSEILELALRTAKRLWSSAIFEDADTGEVFTRTADVPFWGSNEFLVYRDRQSMTQWHEFGAVESAPENLLHFILSDTTLTVVVDAHPSDRIRSYVRELRKAVTQDIFAIKAVANGREYL